MTRSTPEWEMSRSCQSATFSSAAWALPRSTRARPVMRSLTIGLRLCGIADEPFCAPVAKRLARLEQLGALEVADLGRQALEPGAGERDRAEQLGVAVAGDDLRRDRLGPDPQAREHPALVIRAVRGVGAHRARDRPDRCLFECALEALGIAVRLERESRELDSERRRLGVDPVGAADTQGERVGAGLGGERGDELARRRPRRSRRRRAAAGRARCRARRMRSVRSGSSGRPARPRRRGRRRRRRRRGR